ncbi:MAG: hypothetical protein RIS17_118 [Pseudomonadota bacterium]|jgi:hypothetical protein
MTRALVTVLPLAATLLLGGCVGGAAIQPDRSIFTLDNNYQRYSYELPIEEAFDRTVAVFRESGYRLDVVDRATGQISGRRGAKGDKGTGSDKDLKFYALVLPRGDASEIGLKIVQVIKSGTFRSSRAELIVNDRQMYQYTFRRIAGQELKPATPPTPPA